MGGKREEAWPSDEKETQEGYERNIRREGKGCPGVPYIVT